MKGVAMLKRNAIYIIAVMLVSHGSIYAGKDIEKETTQKDVQEIVITGSRIERPGIDEPVSVHVISSEDMAYAGTRTVGDALRWVEGVNISGGATFGAASRTTALIQGLPAQYSLILLDGFRSKSDHIHTGVNLEMIPVSMIERIEVVRGPGSVVHGSDALGGVVNIITKEVPDTSTFVVTGFMGTEDTTNVGVTLGNRWGKFGCLATGYAASSSGLGGPENEYYKGNGRLKLSYDPTEILSMILTLGYYKGQFDTSKDSMAEYKIQFRADTDHLGMFSANLGRSDYDRVFKSGNAITKNNVTTGILQYDRQLWEQHHLTTGLEWRNEEFERLATFEADTNIASLYAQNAYTPAEAWTILFGFRVDNENETGTEFSPRTAVHWHQGLWDVRISVAKGFRIPSLQDLYEIHYDHSTYWRDGNPDLDPERSIHYSLGAEYTFSECPLAVRGMIFRNDVDDMIVLRDTGVIEVDGDPVLRRENLRDAHTHGFEIGFHSRRDEDKNIKWHIAYDFLEAEDDTTGDKLAYNPAHTFKGGISYHKNNMTFNSTVENALDREYRDKNDNILDLDDYILVDCHLIMNLKENIDLSFSVKNVFDEQFETYEEGKTASSYGRFVTIGVKATF